MRGFITNDTMEIKVKEYHKPRYIPQFDNSDAMDQLLKKYKQPKFTKGGWLF